METKRGIAVFPGITSARILVLDPEGLVIAGASIPAAKVPGELIRLESCLGTLSAHLLEDARVIRTKFGAQVAMIFEAHAAMIGDPHLKRSIADLVETELMPVEAAVRKVLGQYAEFFRRQPGGHLQQRAADIADIEKRILKALAGNREDPFEGIEDEVIVVAHDLTPSETAKFRTEVVKGIATETGGRTSHSAIIAAAMGIPSVVGIGPFLAEAKSGAQAILDGNAGMLILDPDPETLQRYRSAARNHSLFVASLTQLHSLPAETKDGVRIRLLGNIEFPHEARQCVERGADGIGLYRTEFLYINSEDPPDEEAHYAAYRKVLEVIGPDRPVTFRTMDLGADKVYPGWEDRQEYNPFLGLRSIRLSLRDPRLFKSQLRALLRASVHGKVKIMFPLISSLQELRRVRLMLRDVVEELTDEGVPFDRKIPIGMMMEVPSAALMAHEFARHVEFFSIGTNDLVQYTLAVDRTNENVAGLYNPVDPAVLMLIRRIVLAGRRNGVEVNVCGEMSGDPVYTMLLLGMGLRQLSVAPHSIAEIKRIVREVTLDACREVAREALKMDSASAITGFLRNRTRRVDPELINDLE
jgi:phosphotransferase system enzyme I (PtsI)